ncbi:hypothetical protein BDY24DRAFT_413531 [Mrakia frigida]|uniref:uncharacterized protein n=1 Tax=Mrakia frigida TaxID=29902 RepID=UPI003FCC1DC9
MAPPTESDLYAYSLLRKDKVHISKEILTAPVGARSSIPSRLQLTVADDQESPVVALVYIYLKLHKPVVVSPIFNALWESKGLDGTAENMRDMMRGSEKGYQEVRTENEGFMAKWREPSLKKQQSQTIGDGGIHSLSTRVENLESLINTRFNLGDKAENGSSDKTSECTDLES